MLALGSAWLVARLDTGVTQDPGTPAGDVPDLYMVNFTTTTMNQQGRPDRRLSAERMAHFPATGIQEFVRPHLSLYQESGEPWQVSSERGVLSADGDELMLLGEVDIWRNNPDGTLGIRIETSDVRVLPDTEYAETDDSALITTASGRTSGVGMRAFLKQERVELLSEVHTIVERIAR